MWSSLIALPLSQLQGKSFLLTKVAIWLVNLFFTLGLTLCAEPESKVYLTENAKPMLRSMWGCLIMAWDPGEQTSRRGRGGWGQQWNEQKLKINVDRWWFLWSQDHEWNIPCILLRSKTILRNMKGVKLPAAMEGRRSSYANFPAEQIDPLSHALCWQTVKKFSRGGLRPSVPGSFSGPRQIFFRERIGPMSSFLEIKFPWASQSAPRLQMAENQSLGQVLQWPCNLWVWFGVFIVRRKGEWVKTLSPI